MNTPLKQLAVVLTLVAVSQALGDSVITYTLELGGNNHASYYEAYEYPDYTRTLDPYGGDGMAVDPVEDINWAVIVEISGIHNDPGGLGDGLPPGGAANLVFDLELRKGVGTTGELVNIGHATLVNGVPHNAGWYSTINDGDNDGDRGAVNGADPEENAAFCMNFDIGGAGSNGGRLFDPAADGGPNMDIYDYPSAQGLPATATAEAGTLIGMGAGYEEFKISSGDTAGVGLTTNSGACIALGDLPLFEGQISTIGLPGGVYTLILKAKTEGNNILLGHSAGYPICDPLWIGGPFATTPNIVMEDTITFMIYGPPPPEVVSAVSCKTHDAAGDFCIDVLNRTGDNDIECRVNGVTKLVVGFDTDIQGVGGLDPSDVALTSGSVDSVYLNASDELTIGMSNTDNGVPLVVTFPGIINASGAPFVCTDSVCIRQLVGDAVADGIVNLVDELYVRNQPSQPSDFRADLCPDGIINACDELAVRDAMGTTFHGTCNIGPPVVQSAESVKTHGTAGNFAINVLERTDDDDIEGRKNGVTKLVVGFDVAIQDIGGVELSSGSAISVVINPSNVLTIEMSDTTDGVPLIVTFPGIANVSDAGLVCTDSVCIRQLVGDVRRDGSINAADRIDVRNQMGVTVTGSNFRSDVRADGSISAGDRIDVRNVMGNGFIGTCP